MNGFSIFAGEIMVVKRNIPLLYLIKVAKWFMLYIPVIYLFYEENNFKVTELFLLHAIYSIVIAFLEVPSGYFADVFGRKLSLVIGALFGTIGFGVYSFSYGLAGFIAAEVLLGIGQSLFSGADSAILYDTLLSENKEKQYMKYEGRITATGNIAEALAGLLVSILAFEVIRNNFYIQTGITFIAFIASVFLIEPDTFSQKRRAGYRDIFEIVKITFHRNKKLRNMVFFSSVIGFASLTMAWFSQPVFLEAGLEKKYFGFAAVVLNGIVALGSILSLRVKNWLSFKGLLFFISFPLSLGYLAIAFKLSFYAFIPMILFYFVRGTAHPALKYYINIYTTSDKRATVLSLRSLLIRIIYSSMAPLLGVMTDKISLEIALTACGLSILFFAGIFMFMILRYPNSPE
jgi:MFS family permease